MVKSNQSITPWHVLHEEKLIDLSSAVGTLGSYTSSPLFETIFDEKVKISDALLNHPRIRQLSTDIERITGHDGGLILCESLGEMPFAHLGVIHEVNKLLHDYQFPVIEVLRDAYFSGLIPFGFYDERFEPSGVMREREILMCLDPRNLEAN